MVEHSDTCDMDRSSALAAATSDQWAERVAAAGVLARMDDAESQAALLRLLQDENLAPVAAASRAVLMRASEPSLALFTSAYAEADDQVGDCMNDELCTAASADKEVVAALERLAGAGDAGAQRCLDWLG
jgi:HEAT repeat protein